MDGTTIMSTLQDKIAKLDKCIGSLGKLGRAKAEAEMEYRISIAQFVLVKKSEGMAISLIETVSKGEPEIAQKKMAWDIAEVMYESCDSAIQGIKKEIDVLREIAQREWSQAK